MLAMWMLYAVLVSGLVGLGALLAERGLEATGRPVRGVWAMAFLVAIGVIALPAPSWVSGWQPTGLEAASPVGAPSAGPVANAAVPAAGADTPGSPEALTFWLLGLWAAAALLLLLRWGVRWWRTRAISEGWSQVRLPEGEVLVSADAGPAVVGILEPRVVLPRWCLELSSRERALILAHEREHERARDGLLLAAAGFLVSAVPWNLPFWAFLWRLRESVEVDCDARVLRNQPEAKRPYGELLIRMASAQRGPPLASSMTVRPRSTVSRRIQRLVANRQGMSRARLLGLVSLATLALAGSCLVPGPDREVADPTGPDEVSSQGEASPDAKLSSEPTFTPYTEPPEVQNRDEVRASLQREYPDELRAAGVGGTTVVYLFVNEDGEVENALTARSSGHESLDAAALRVAEAFRFTPARNRDRRVPVWIQIPLIFQADDAPGEVDDPPGAVEDADRRVWIRDTTEPRASRPPHAAEDVSREPMFTPYTVEPELRNRSEVTGVLQREYPDELRAAGIGGTAVVYLYVDRNGEVGNVRTARSSGHEVLDAAALEVARSFQFTPALNRDQQVPVWIQIPVVFEP